MKEMNRKMNTLKLFSETKNDKLLTLTYSIYKNMFRCYINVMDKDFKNREFLTSVALTPINARMISNELTKLPKLKEPYEFELKLFGAKYVDDKREEGRTKTGSIKIMKAKNKDGDLVNVIQIVDKIDKQYNFVLKNTPYVDIYVNGNKITDMSKISNTWCNSYAKTFSDVLSLIPESVEQESPVTNF